MALSGTRKGRATRMAPAHAPQSTGAARTLTGGTKVSGEAHPPLWGGGGKQGPPRWGRSHVGPDEPRRALARGPQGELQLCVQQGPDLGHECRVQATPAFSSEKPDHRVFAMSERPAAKRTQPSWDDQLQTAPPHSRDHGDENTPSP